MGDTGVGATITFSDGFTGAYREIGNVRASVEDVDNNTLDNPSDQPATFLAGDNPVYEDVVCIVRYDPTETPPALRTNQTITITPAKENTASTNPANMAGSGYVKSWDFIPNMQRNQLNVAQVVIRYDGVTGPAFTPEA